MVNGGQIQNGSPFVLNKVLASSPDSKSAYTINTCCTSSESMISLNLPLSNNGQANSHSKLSVNCSSFCLLSLRISFGSLVK